MDYGMSIWKSYKSNDNVLTAYHDASNVVRSIPRCNMALKRSVSGNGTFAINVVK